MGGRPIVWSGPLVAVEALVIDHETMSSGSNRENGQIGRTAWPKQALIPPLWFAVHNRRLASHWLSSLCLWVRDELLPCSKPGSWVTILALAKQKPKPKIEIQNPKPGGSLPSSNLEGAQATSPWNPHPPSDPSGDGRAGSSRKRSRRRRRQGPG